MATTTADVESHRLVLADLATLAQRDLAEFWGTVDPLDAAGTVDALRAFLPDLTTAYGEVAAGIAADFYDDLREGAEVSGAYTARLADPPPVGRTDALARWATSPLFAPFTDAAADLALSKVAGGVQRIITDTARQTVAGSAVADPAADGWQRAGRGGCPFCLMLIARGAVYRESTARFASHDHCRCAAVPAFGGRPRPVEPYTPSERTITDADRTRLRRYLRENPAAAAPAPRVRPKAVKPPPP